MPDEPNAIAPALDDDQWRYWLKDHRLLDFQLDVAADHFSYDIHQSRPALMALANAALPDDDPRKITREDVALLGQAADTWENEGGDPIPLHALAAKLEALLPPED